MLVFPKYESYQSTEIEWLGEIPEHWGLKKNKFLLLEKKNTVGKHSSNFTLLSLTLQGVIARDMENPQGKFPAEFNTYKIVEPNDLIFCLFDVEETPRTVGHANQEGMITGAYDVFECNEEIDSRFLYYYYLSLDFDKRLKPLYSGLRKVIKIDVFLSTKSPVPPIGEQRRIVDFLDRKTAEIDQAIAQKQHLIELLQEQKAILINQAVTKGLDPDVPMRNSQVDWFGEIPEHWAKTKIKHIARFISGGTPSKENIEFWNGNISWVSPKDMKQRYIDTSEDKITSKALQKTKLQLLELNTVLIIVRGMILARKVPISLTRVPTTINQDMKALVLNDACLPEYLLFLLEGVNNNLSVLIEEAGHGTKTLPTDKLGNFAIPLPPKNEQEGIIQFIKSNEIEIESSIEITAKQISLLEELKHIAISEAVTGKIKI